MSMPQPDTRPFFNSIDSCFSDYEPFSVWLGDRMVFSPNPEEFKRYRAHKEEFCHIDLVLKGKTYTLVSTSNSTYSFTLSLFFRGLLHREDDSPLAPPQYIHLKYSEFFNAELSSRVSCSYETPTSFYTVGALAPHLITILLIMHICLLKDHSASFELSLRSTREAFTATVSPSVQISLEELMNGNEFLTDLLTSISESNGYAIAQKNDSSSFVLTAPAVICRTGGHVLLHAANVDIFLAQIHAFAHCILMPILNRNKSA